MSNTPKPGQLDRRSYWFKLKDRYIQLKFLIDDALKIGAFKSFSKTIGCYWNIPWREIYTTIEPIINEAEYNNETKAIYIARRLAGVYPILIDSLACPEFMEFACPQEDLFRLIAIKKVSGTKLILIGYLLTGPATNCIFVRKIDIGRIKKVCTELGVPYYEVGSKVWYKHILSGLTGVGLFESTEWQSINLARLRATGKQQKTNKAIARFRLNCSEFQRLSGGCMGCFRGYADTAAGCPASPHRRQWSTKWCRLCCKEGTGRVAFCDVLELPYCYSCWSNKYRCKLDRMETKIRYGMLRSEI